MSVEMNTTEKIINKAIDICTKNSIEYCAFSSGETLTLSEAITIIILFKDNTLDPNLKPNEVYQLISSYIND